MLIITGTIAFDNILNFNGRFADYILPDKIHKINISFITDDVKREFGGTAGNQAYSLALLGENPYLFTTVGNDFADYRTYLEKVGVLTEYAELIPDKPSAVGFAMTDQDDNQIWAFGNGAAGEIIDFSVSYFLEKLRLTSQPFVLIAPMHEDAMVKWARECRELNIRYMFDPAFQIPKMGREDLREAVEGAEIVFGNDYEVASLSAKLKAQISKLQLKSQNLKVVVETLGANGSIIYDLKGEKQIKIEPAKPKEVVDPTGAGDAYRAGFVAGYLRRAPLKVCGQMGSVAASFAIERYGTINHSFTLEEFRKRYKDTYTEILQF